MLKKEDKKNIKLGAISVYLSLIVSILNAFILTPVILRNFGENLYGLYSFSISITSWISVIVNALTASYIHFVTRDFQDNNSSKKTDTIYHKLIILICLFLFLVTISTLLFLYFSGFRLSQYSDSENNLIYLLLGLTAFQSLVSIYFSFYTLYLKFKQKHAFTGFLNLIISFCIFILKFAFAFVVKEIYVLVIIDIALNLISGVISLVFCFSSLKLEFNSKEKLKYNKLFIKEIFYFSGFLILNTIAEQINNHADISILGFLSTSSDVTTYQLSFTFCSYLSNIPVAIATLFIPTINEYAVTGQKEALDDLFLKVSKYQTIFVLLIVGGFVVCGIPFLNLWLGEKRLDIYVYSIVLLIVHSVPLTVNLAIEVQRAYNKHKFRAISMLIISLVNILSSSLMVYFLPSEFSVLCCVLCTCATKVIGVWIIFNIYNQRVIKLPMKKYVVSFTKILVYTIIAVVPAFGIGIKIKSLGNIAWFLTSGFTFVIFYSLILLIFEKDTILNLIKKFKKGGH